MSINYRMIFRGDYLNPNEKKKTGFYPQVVRKSTVSIKDLAEKMSFGKRLGALEAEVYIRALLASIEFELLEGNSVCLNDFGTFSLTAECRDVTNPDEIRAESISVKRVVFTPSKALRGNMRMARFVRGRRLPDIFTTE